jgi:ribosomal-protein-alanine N-acetyltransferase
VPATARPLGSRDLDRVVAIERIAFTDPWPRSAFVELLAQAHVRAFAVDGPGSALAGYALASVVADEGEILNLAVEPGLRRQGLGQLLLDALLATFRSEGVATVHLEVRESNAAAMHLYERAGFRPVSVRRGYYRNPTENAVTMALPLSPKVAEKG